MADEMDEADKDSTIDTNKSLYLDAMGRCLLAIADSETSRNL